MAGVGANGLIMMFFMFLIITFIILHTETLQMWSFLFIFNLAEKETDYEKQLKEEEKILDSIAEKKGLFNLVGICKS